MPFHSKTVGRSRPRSDDGEEEAVGDRPRKIVRTDGVSASVPQTPGAPNDVDDPATSLTDTHPAQINATLTQTRRRLKHARHKANRKEAKHNASDNLGHEADLFKDSEMTR